MSGVRVSIEKGPADWQILQHHNGSATVYLEGRWMYEQEMIPKSSVNPLVLVRLMDEQDNSQIIPWVEAETTVDTSSSGAWKIQMELPAGGLYRLETSLDMKIDNHRVWVRQGDLREHLGVGNVFVIAGQSNAVGYGRCSAWDPPMLGVHLFRNCGRWDLAVHPFNEGTDTYCKVNVDQGKVGTSPFLTFGKQFKALSGLPVGFVITALGGSLLSRWVTSQDGDLYRNMLERIDDAGGSVAAVLWYQGCSDASQEDNASTYYDRFAQFVQNVRRDVQKDLPIFTFQLNRRIFPPVSDLWLMVQEAQRKAAVEIPGVYVMSTTDSNMSDGIHNNSDGNIKLGTRMARQCAGVLCSARPFAAPDIVSASFFGNKLQMKMNDFVEGLSHYNHKPGEGFCIEDSEGILSVEAWDLQKNVITFTLDRVPCKNVTISYSSSKPEAFPNMCDTVNYVPLLAFRKFPVQAAKTDF